MWRFERCLPILFVFEAEPSCSSWSITARSRPVRPYIQRHFSRNYKQGSRCHQAQVSSEVVPCDWIFDVEDSIYRYLHLPMWHASYWKCASCEVSWHGTGMVLSSLAVDACLKINRTIPHHSIICIEKNKQEARSCVLLY